MHMHTDFAVLTNNSKFWVCEINKLDRILNKHRDISIWIQLEACKLKNAATRSSLV